MRLCLFALILLAGVLAASVAVGEGPSRTFPLGRSLAGDRELPDPYGVGVTFHSQKQDYNLTKLMVSLPGIDPAAAAGIVVENSTQEANLKLDLWLLPFLNVFGIVGYVDGTTEVALGPPLGGIDVDYDGLVYGGGLTLAGGTERFFGSLTTVLTNTDLDVSTSSVEALIITPRIGLRTSFGEVWVGAMYQQTDEKHSGVIALPPIGAVAYEVELEEEEPWNYLAGLKLNAGEDWSFEIEGGVGERRHVTASVTYRF